MEEILDKYRGCLIGLALGDVLGVPFEFWQREKVADYLSLHELKPCNFNFGEKTFPDGFYSDDTAMMICLAESLIKKGFDMEDQYDRYNKWYLTGYATPFDDKCYGIGQQTLRSLMCKADSNALDGSNINAGGNGSLMRSAPLGLYYYNDLDNLKDKSLLSSYLTHNYIISGWTCVILNTIIALIIKGFDKKNIILKIKEMYSEIGPKEVMDLLNIDYGQLDESDLRSTGYSVESLKIALWSFLTTSNYSESIKKVILLGGDTDTYAAITGAITGCYYGYNAIPESHKKKVIKHDYIINLADQLYDKVFN